METKFSAPSPRGRLIDGLTGRYHTCETRVPPPAPSPDPLDGTVFDDDGSTGDGKVSAQAAQRCGDCRGRGWQPQGLRVVRLAAARLGGEEVGSLAGADFTAVVVVVVVAAVLSLL